MEENSTPLISFSEADILGGEDNIVVYGLDLQVYPGQLVYIIGKVGSGKTSIFRTITAENRLAKGSGEVCGYDLTRLRKKEIPFLRRKIGVVFQDFQLLMDRSVEDNLVFVLKATGWKDTAAIHKRIGEVLEAVDMSTKSHKMPHQLSGGEQQRVAIARAILNNPAVILADEPTGNLDEETAEGILQLLQQINREQGTAIVMVTHNRSICTRFPGRVFETRDESCQEITL
ncbi:MAG: ATP-binding cassette domain-containing protein [Bacteroidales bacterium]|nr:ATP-binding cassette domain-containing protein [Bacteroidales bacterium]